MTPTDLRLPPNTRLLHFTSDGRAVLICTHAGCGRDYVGIRPCPKCQAREMAAEDRARTGGDAA